MYDTNKDKFAETVRQRSRRIASTGLLARAKRVSGFPSLLMWVSSDLKRNEGTYRNNDVYEAATHKKLGIMVLPSLLSVV